MATCKEPGCKKCGNPMEAKKMDDEKKEEKKEVPVVANEPIPEQQDETFGGVNSTDPEKPEQGKNKGKKSKKGKRG